MRVDVRRAPHAVARAFGATALVMGGAVTAHTLAGGHVPDGAALIALGALVLGCSLLAMHDAVPAWCLLGAVAATQLGLHAAFAVVPPMHDHAGVAVGTADHAAWTWEMLLAHGAVTGLTALVWRLCSRAAVVVVELGAQRAALVLPHAPRPRSRHVALPSGFLACLTVAPRRGPPRLA